MAFTGVAVVEKIADDLVRITGISLGISAVGTIGLFGDGAANVQLPDAFDPKAYADVSLSDSVQVSAVQDGGGAPLATMMLTIAKAEAPFQITVTNRIATATGTLEIYVRFH